MIGAIEEAKKAEIEDSNCNAIAEACAKAEVTMRQTNAAGKAARKQCVLAVTPKTKLETSDKRSEKNGAWASTQMQMQLKVRC